MGTPPCHPASVSGSQCLAPWDPSLGTSGRWASHSDTKLEAKQRSGGCLSQLLLGAGDVAPVIPLQ